MSEEIEIVKNACFGGYGLSPLAVKRLAELQGKDCYFFEGGLSEPYNLITIEEASRGIFWFAFSVINPNEFLPQRDMPDYSVEEHNNAYDKISLDDMSKDRTNPLLIKVVKELGEKANGACARLEIVKIPADIEWEIDEYDGNETIREKHRTW
jgi:hypothetical protein